MNAREQFAQTVWENLILLMVCAVGSGVALILIGLGGSILSWAAFGFFLGGVYNTNKRITLNLKKLVDTK